MKPSSIQTAQPLCETPIAIVGMACLFPQAGNLSQYWDNIVREVDCITDIPPSRWQMADYFNPDPGTPDKTYSKRGGFIPETDFDPTEFGLPPNILEVTDVSQLLSLVVAREALKDAGYGETRSFDRDRTGVILGVGGGQKLIVPLAARLQAPVWRRVLENSGISGADADRIVEQIKAAYIPWEENSFPGLLGNVIAGRIANRFNLGGTNCVVDAACASSLGAAKMAIDDLIDGRSDMMITGGVDADNSIFMYMCFSKTLALTPGDHARPFDADADGILIGEGIGMLVLKRLADARRDNDRIYAVIRGIGTASDGRSKSIYAPSENGQVKALKRAYGDAGIAPETVSLIEAHGTGTRAGDICEVEALTKVFTAGKPQHIALGSVKSQIGHTKASAGAAGLIKTALSLYHKVLPPTLHITTPNPKMNFDASPFYLNTQARPWFRTSHAPRRAGVSAFGFGGTNFHVVLEESEVAPQGPFRLQTVARPILLYADTPADLVSRCEQALTGLDAERGFHDLVDACRSCNIPAHAARIGFVADTAAEARNLLKTAIDTLRKKNGETVWEHPAGISYRNSALPENAKMVALFPGQGSQYIGMGRELAITFPALRQTWEAMDDLFVEAGKAPLTRLVFPPPAFSDAARSAQVETLTRTEHAQPAIGAFSAGLYKLLQSAGFQPDMVAGHSFGELAALWAAGVFSETDFLALSKIRGEAMTAANGADAGAMLAAKTSADDIRNMLGDLQNIAIANDNAPDQIVLAGPTGDMLIAQKTLESRGINTRRLPVSAAFHTPLVAHAQAPFSERLKNISFDKPNIPVYANATAAPYPGHAPSVRNMLKEHMCNPVRFREQIETIYADGGRCFVEIGPRSTLTNLVKKILKDRPHIAIALNAASGQDSDRQFRQALIRLRVAGLPLVDIDPHAISPPVQSRKNKMNIRLSGYNCVSEKTRENFERALQKGHRIQTSKAPPLNQKNRDSASPHQPHAPSSPQTATQGDPMSHPLPHAHVAAQNPELAQRMLESLERSISQFYALQAETLRVHEHYMQGQMEYARTFFHLIQQQYALLGMGAVSQSPPVSPPQTWSPPAPPPHTWSAPAPMPAPPAAPVPKQSSAPSASSGNNPIPAQPAPSTGTLDATALTRSLLSIVSEKTGYPEDVVELDMNMEADLGIDSIKRVEILGAMIEAHPELPSVNPEDLAELQTLAQIVEHMKTLMDKQSASMS